MDFAVSTTAFRRQPIEKVIQTAIAEDLQIEFSSGLPYREDMPEVFLNCGCRRLLHNYSPAPKVPFVLNLASMDAGIHEQSLAHCRECLSLTARAGSPFYSVHAGFCLDPPPDRLGKKLGLVPQHSKEKHWKRFVASIETLAHEAEKLGIGLLVENNVLASFNLLPDGGNPLLCAEPDDIALLLREVPSPALGMLIDTGHLKVSAKTLDFRIETCLEVAHDRIRAFHHSDNDGIDDSNQSLAGDYWFLKHMTGFKVSTHVLEVHDQTVSQVKAQFALMSAAADGRAGRL